MQPDEAAKLFLQYDYGEGKALCTQFLTVVVAVLVVSLTFSEKIADFPKASKLVKCLLLAAWCLFVLAIILGGLAIYFMARAAENAFYGGTSYYQIQSKAMYIAVAGGCAFVLGLISLISSAAVTIFKSP